MTNMGNVIKVSKRLSRREERIIETIKHLSDWWEGDAIIQELAYPSAGPGMMWRVGAYKHGDGYRARYQFTLGWNPTVRTPKWVRSSRLYKTMEAAKRVALKAAIEKAIEGQGDDWDDAISRRFFGGS
jgi:hypothetical protein